jgi:tripeptidyl-peptidase-1
MRSSFLTGALTALLTVCTAVPTPNSYSLHEKRSSLPRLWSRGSRVDQDAILPIRIGLTQSNLENSYAHLMDV